MNTRTHAVLTGDVIKSSRLDADGLKTVRATVRDSVDEVKSWQRGLVRGQVEFFRGDSWQLLLLDPSLALRVAILIRAALIAGGIADSRVSAAIGTVEQIDTSKISRSTGQAFKLSGETLDALRAPRRLALTLPESHGSPAESFRIIATLCDALINEWTPRQAEVVRLAIVPASPKQADIAHRLRPSVSQQFVSKALKGANWDVVHQAIRYFEDNQKRLFLKNQPKGVVN
ncbi:MAG: hypothetical protein ACP5I4_07320 [Oceanipulchritudo sp.]